MKIRQYLIVSFVVSVLIHLLVFGLTSNLYLDRGMNLKMDSARKTDRKNYPIRLGREQKPREQAPQPQEKRPFASTKKIAAINSEIRNNLQKESVVSRKLEKVFQQEKLSEPVSVKYRLATRQEAFGGKPDAGRVKSVEMTAPRPKIVEIDLNRLARDRQVLPNRMIAPKLERLDSSAACLPSLAAHGPLNGGGGGAFSLSLKSGRKRRFGSLSGDADFLEFESGEQKVRRGLSVGGRPSAGDEYLWKILNRPAGAASPMPLDQFVEVNVRVLHDKVGSGGFFQVEISPNETSDSLRDVSKDSLFVIDHSNSISIGKLNEFKAAAIEALSYLNPSDRFNVVSFTDRARALFPGFQPIDANGRSRAASYIGSLTRGGMTDVFGGLAPFVKQSNGNMDRPLNIFLLTDGQSTVNIRSADDFLRSITGINPGNVSIYPFSAGRNANRELLDYLGYLNRGRISYVQSVSDLRRNVVEFISEHSSLIMMDIRYMIDERSRAEIFPRALPHLYRHSTMRLYGRYENEDDELVLAITGRDYRLRYCDLVFRRKYRACGRGEQRIAQEWAAQKIYCLLAEKNCVTDQKKRDAMDAEILKLTREFGLDIER